MKNFLFIFSILFLLSYSASYVSAVVSAAPHAKGANVLGPDGTVYMIHEIAVSPPCVGCEPTIQRSKLPYPSATVFLSYSFNSWDRIFPASMEDLGLPTGSPLPPAPGALIQQQGAQTVYFVTTHGKKIGFTSYQAFLDLGYNPNNILLADISYLSSETETGSVINTSSAPHPRGTVVNQDGTLYLIGYGNVAGHIKYGIPNMRIFNYYGFSLKNVVPANNYDRQLNQVSVVYLSDLATGSAELPLNLP